MSDIYQADNTPNEITVVEITLTVSYATAIWLCEIAQMHGDQPQNVAARILDDVARDDRIAHNESETVTLQ